LISLALTVTYAAMVALYHAHPKRASGDVLAWVPNGRLALLRVAGAVLLAFGFVLCVVGVDVARGTSIWFGMLSVAAAASLVCATLRPSRHLASVPAVAFVAVLTESLRAWV